MQLGRRAVAWIGLGISVICGDGCSDSHTLSGNTGPQSGAQTPQGVAEGALGSGCLSDKNCTADRLICDLSRNICVDCMATADCPSGQVCLDSVCVGANSCQTSADCRDYPDHAICDTGRCVECARDNDCAGTGNTRRCVGSMCRNGCSADEDCPSTHFCSDRACMPTVCFGDRSKYCVYDQLLTCDKKGSGFLSAGCTEGCEASGGEAHCKGSVVATSSSETGGTSAIVGTEDNRGAGGSATVAAAAGHAGGTTTTSGASGPNSTCPEGSAGSGDPCQGIPQFQGTQIVDGAGDEFCGIPSKVIDLGSAGYKDPTGVQDTTTQAIVRVGWSTTALHAHVHVHSGSTGNLVQGNPNLYDGDNVQFFISAGAFDGGSEATSQIFVGPPAGGVAARSNLATGSASYDWTARTVTGGYEVELRWPWTSGGGAVAAGQKIALYVLIGVSGTSGREVEYGFALASTTSAACTAQGRPPQPWCDSTLWCTPTLQ